jgi:hypothetical protein
MNWCRRPKSTKGCRVSKTVVVVVVVVVVVLVVVVIIITIPFMRGIHTYIPDTNRVSRVYSDAAILHVLLMVHIALSAILNSFVLLH